MAKSHVKCQARKRCRCQNLGMVLRHFRWIEGWYLQQSSCGATPQWQHWREVTYKVRVK